MYLNVRTSEFQRAATKFQMARVFPPQSGSASSPLRGDTLLSALLLSLPFSLWFCLEYLYPYRVHCLVLHVFEPYVDGIMEEACTLQLALFSHFYPEIRLCRLHFIALYEYNTFYFSALSGHFSSRFFALANSSVVRVSYYVCKRNSLGNAQEYSCWGIGTQIFY